MANMSWRKLWPLGPEIFYWLLTVKIIGYFSSGRIRSDPKFVFGGNRSNEGDCSMKIQRRIEMAKGGMFRFIRLWKNRQISNNIKMRLVQSLVFSFCMEQKHERSICQTKRSWLYAYIQCFWNVVLEENAKDPLDNSTAQISLTSLRWGFDWFQSYLIEFRNILGT